MTTNLTPRTDKAVFREKVVRGEPVAAQEVFDVAVEGVILQGGPSTNTVGWCLYRGDGGRACAVGQLIPDDLYAPELEGNKITLIVKSSRGSISASLREHGRLLMTLQGIHDDLVQDSPEVLDGVIAGTGDEDFLRHFKRKIGLLAENIGLTVPPLAQIEEPSGAPV